MNPQTLIQLGEIFAAGAAAATKSDDPEADASFWHRVFCAMAHKCGALAEAQEPGLDADALILGATKKIGW